MAQQAATIPLVGGLDLISPALMVKPGFVIQAKNYEAEARGYRRISGYEGYDGQASAIDTDYYILDLDAINATLLDGDVITGATSGASATVLADSVLDSSSPPVGTLTYGNYSGYTYASLRGGRYGLGLAYGYVALYGVTGTFTDGEELQVSSVSKAIAYGTQQLNAAPTAALHETYRALAEAEAGGSHAAVTGSGEIRGIFFQRGTPYAVRDNAGGTAGVLWRATAGGWTQVTPGETLHFTSGTAAFAEDETVTGGTSGATATIERVVRNDGAWSGTASGYLVLSGVSGTFQNGETITSAGGSATANGANAAITLPAGGTYRAIEHNFYGQSTTSRTYVVNGVGRAFEFDGTVLAPIETGLSASLDKPNLIAVHKEHLVLGFDRGSLQYSALGLPLVFDAAQGAGEIGFGADLTGITAFTRDVTVVTAKNRIGYLAGESGAFVMKVLSDTSGAFADTLQVVDEPIYLDDRGVRRLSATEAFGDWSLGTLSLLVEPLIREKRLAGVTPVGSLKVRAKDQYRIFYSDGSGLVIYLGRGTPEIMPIQYDFTPVCFVSGEDANGEEILLVGADDGWVYRLDRGSSFDGEEIEAFVRTSFLNLGSPNQFKRFHRVFVEGHAAAQALTLQVSARYTYDGGEQPAGVATSHAMTGGGDYWTETHWTDPHGRGTAVEARAVAALDGMGRDASLYLYSSSTQADHTLSALTINFSPRRRAR